MKCTKILTAIVSLLFISTANADLVLYYDFEDDVLDNSAEGNNGTVTGTATYSTDVPIAPTTSKSFSFNAATYITAASAFDFSGEQMSLSLWMKSGATAANFEKVLATSFNDAGIQVERRSTSSNARFLVQGNNMGQYENLPSAMDQSWHHIAVVVDDGSVVTWVDGTQKYSLSYDTGTLSIQQSRQLVVGAWINHDGGSMYKGLLDDLAIWDRVLTPVQVAALNSGVSPLVVVSSITLSNDTVSTNAAPGTLVGTLSYDDADDFDVVVTGTGGDSADFEVTSATNLRTKVWMDAASKDISVVAYSNSTPILTNDFTITVSPSSSDDLVFVVSAEVQNAAPDGTVVGTADTLQSSPTFSVSGGRTDLFYFDGSDLKLTNSASWGGVGTTNYVTLQATDGVATNELVVITSVVSNVPEASIFRFR
jgi:hypothetical protein